MHLTLPPAVAMVVAQMESLFLMNLLQCLNVAILIILTYFIYLQNAREAERDRASARWQTDSWSGWGPSPHLQTLDATPTPRSWGRLFLDLVCCFWRSEQPITVAAAGERTDTPRTDDAEGDNSAGQDDAETVAHYSDTFPILNDDVLDCIADAVSATGRTVGVLRLFASRLDWPPLTTGGRGRLLMRYYRRCTVGRVPDYSHIVGTERLPAQLATVIGHDIEDDLTSSSSDTFRDMLRKEKKMAELWFKRYLEYAQHVVLNLRHPSLIYRIRSQSPIQRAEAMMGAVAHLRAMRDLVAVDVSFPGCERDDDIDYWELAVGRAISCVGPGEHLTHLTIRWRGRATTALTSIAASPQLSHTLQSLHLEDMEDLPTDATFAQSTRRLENIRLAYASSFPSLLTCSASPMVGLCIARMSPNLRRLRLITRRHRELDVHEGRLVVSVLSALEHLLLSELSMTWAVWAAAGRQGGERFRLEHTRLPSIHTVRVFDMPAWSISHPDIAAFQVIMECCTGCSASNLALLEYRTPVQTGSIPWFSSTSPALQTWLDGISTSMPRLRNLRHFDTLLRKCRCKCGIWIRQDRGTAMPPHRDHAKNCDNRAGSTDDLPDVGKADKCLCFCCEDRSRNF